MPKSEAGREGVRFDLFKNRMHLYYKPHTQMVLLQKSDGELKSTVKTIGPPDGVMAKIWVSDYGDSDELMFSLDRECVPVFDSGGPWVRERRSLEELNEYLRIFGLVVSGVVEDQIDVKVVEPVEPSFYCDHEVDFYSLRVLEEEFIGGSGFCIEAEVSCKHCDEARVVTFVIPEEDGEWSG